MTGAFSGEDNRTRATVDRLMHHAHLCATAGESVRLAQAVAGQGVEPLADSASGTATRRQAPRDGQP